jgi:hypothetical protein
LAWVFSGVTSHVFTRVLTYLFCRTYQKLHPNVVLRGARGGVYTTDILNKSKFRQRPLCLGHPDPTNLQSFFCISSSGVCLICSLSRGCVGIERIQQQRIWIIGLEYSIYRAFVIVTTSKSYSSICWIISSPFLNPFMYCYRVFCHAPWIANW